MFELIKLSATILDNLVEVLSYITDKLLKVIMQIFLIYPSNMYIHSFIHGTFP